MKTGTVLLGCKKPIGSTKRSNIKFDTGDKVKYLGQPAVVRAVTEYVDGSFAYDVKYESENGKKVARQVPASTLEK